MKDLQELANKAVFDYLESGKLEEKLNDSVEKCFSECVDGAFRWGSFCLSNV